MLEALREAVLKVVQDALGRREVRRGKVLSNDAASKSSIVREEESGLDDEVSWGVGVELVPVVGSNVWYVAADDTETSLVLLKAEVMLGLQLLLQGCKLELDAEGLQVVAPLLRFNGGENGGLVIVAALVAKLNRLEQQLVTHQHICSAPGSPSAPDPVSNPVIALATVAELSNPKVLH